MKRGQATNKSRYFASLGAGGWSLALASATFGMLVAQPLRAAIDPMEGSAARPALVNRSIAQATPPAADAVVPPVRREAPATPAAPPTGPPPAAPPAAPSPAVAPVKKPDPAPQPSVAKSPPPPPEFSGVIGTVQEWLARANREYQGVVVKELSLPQSGAPSVGDEIAKKLKEQQAEDAQKAAAAKRAEDAARQAAEDKAAAAAKAAETNKLDEDRRRAEATKRLADEAKKKADEVLKAEQPAPKVEAVAPPAPKPDDAAALAAKALAAKALAEKALAEKARGEQKRLEAQKAEAQKLEAQKLADESKRQDQLRKDEQLRQDQVRKDAQGKADEARRVEDQRKKAEAARVAAETVARRRASEVAQPAAPASKQTTRKIVLTAEPLPAPIARPIDPGITFRPEMARARTTRVTQAEANAEPVPPQRRRIRVYHEPTYRGITPATSRTAHRGPAVKRWVMRSGSCNAAGRRIAPPARYTVKRGDSLWRISERHYHQGSLFPKIYSANRASISDPDLIYPCQRVLVPKKR